MNGASLEAGDRVVVGRDLELPNSEDTDGSESEDPDGDSDERDAPASTAVTEEGLSSLPSSP